MTDLQAQLEASGVTQLSLTHPESRAMKLGKGRGTEVCYNVQTAVDSQAQAHYCQRRDQRYRYQERQVAGTEGTMKQEDHGHFGRRVELGREEQLHPQKRDTVSLATVL